ncbi:hypothetical protein Sango_0032500 [Sesamum angolense]|uniref:Retrotransposon gag domain-containing protein n=1 Tax=Sesamum angolense TaxID=2727404 RepID=A0AAE2C5P2_9LAMI|nr:hypothetical protein Sango_0032500 [Sesamum angolense]
MMVSDVMGKGKEKTRLREIKRRRNRLERREWLIERGAVMPPEPHGAPSSALRKTSREKWYQSLGAIMGPRRVAVTQANSAARMSGQDAEGPRHATSPSERAANPEDENSRLIDLVMNLEEIVSSLETDIMVLNSELEECRQIGLLQHAVSNVPAVAHDAGARFRIPEPKAYDGACDAKEVENFLFDMEQYLLAANVEDEVRKVSTATMYLTGDAKLWWRTKYAEIQANQVRLDTWALLREAIREQFFQENVEYNARQALRKLEHTGSVRDYVKAFSARCWISETCRRRINSSLLWRA